MKISSTLYKFALLFALFSCQNENKQSNANSETILSIDSKVNLPIDTVAAHKSNAKTPLISSTKVACLFDGSPKFIDSKPAQKDSTRIPVQEFTISPNENTILESKEGLIYAIPKDAFVNANGEIIKTPVTLTIKEAITASQIIKAELSTTSDGKLLETAGMFYLSASSSNDEVYINEEHPIIAKIPAKEYKEGMMLFSSEKREDGSINWVKPQKLEKDLVSVEITSLDFYPKGFEEKLKALNYDKQPKEWKDSLFFSFSSEFKKEKEEGIRPSKIKAIWTEEFNNTNLATREFEKRLQNIYATCDEKILDLYVKNLDQNLWVIDEKAASMSTGKQKENFQKFAAERCTKVKSNGLNRDLSNFYELRAEAYQKAIDKTNADYWEKQKQLDIEFALKDAEQKKIVEKINQQNFEKELAVNLRESYKQAGLQIPQPNLTASIDDAPVLYSAEIRTTGWCNIDRFAEQATIARQSQKMKINEKEIHIEYHPFEVSIDNSQEYDRINSYLLSNELYSFQKMNRDKNIFKENLNGFMQYNLAVIAYKGEQAFFYSKKNLPKGGKTTASLQEISSDDLNLKINQLTSINITSDLQNEMIFEALASKNSVRQKNNQEMFNLRNSLKPIVLPCLELEPCSMAGEYHSKDELNGASVFYYFRLNQDKSFSFSTETVNKGSISAQHGFKGNWELLENNSILRLTLTDGNVKNIKVISYKAGEFISIMYQDTTILKMSCADGSIKKK